MMPIGDDSVIGGDEYRAYEREVAEALTAFTHFTYTGALHVLRHRRDIVEIAIEQVAFEGAAQCEQFLAKETGAR